MKLNRWSFHLWCVSSSTFWEVEASKLLSKSFEYNNSVWRPKLIGFFSFKAYIYFVWLCTFIPNVCNHVQTKWISIFISNEQCVSFGCPSTELQDNTLESEVGTSANIANHNVNNILKHNNKSKSEVFKSYKYKCSSLTVQMDYA